MLILLTAVFLWNIMNAKIRDCITYCVLIIRKFIGLENLSERIIYFSIDFPPYYTDTDMDLCCTFIMEWGGKCLLSQSKSGRCVHFLVNLSGKRLSQWGKVKLYVAPWKIQPRSNPLNLGRSQQHSGKTFQPALQEADSI